MNPEKQFDADTKLIEDLDRQHRMDQVNIDLYRARIAEMEWRPCSHCGALSLSSSLSE